MDYQVTIIDARKLAAASFLLDADNQPTTFKDFTPLTPAEYIDFVVNMAALSYANQYKAP